MNSLSGILGVLVIGFGIFMLVKNNMGLQTEKQSLQKDTQTLGVTKDSLTKVAESQKIFIKSIPEDIKKSADTINNLKKNIIIKDEQIKFKNDTLATLRLIKNNFDLKNDSLKILRNQFLSLQKDTAKYRDTLKIYKIDPKRFQNIKENNKIPPKK